MAQNPSTPTTGSNPFLVIVYWAIVAVPLGWGVYKTVQKSIPLFNGAVAAPAASATPAPSATAAPAQATPAATPTQGTAVAPTELLPPTPEASPFSTAQPSATVPPVVAPTTPTT